MLVTRPTLARDIAKLFVRAVISSPAGDSQARQFLIFPRVKKKTGNQGSARLHFAAKILLNSLNRVSRWIRAISKRRRKKRRKKKWKWKIATTMFDARARKQSLLDEIFKRRAYNIFPSFFFNRAKWKKRWKPREGIIIFHGKEHYVVNFKECW